MRGLLIKDFQLVKNQKTTLFIFLAISLAMLLSQWTYFSFVFGFLTFSGLIFTIGTFSYDEFQNGLSFLMTLPIQRKHYVQEKYLFGWILITIFCLVSLVLAIFGANYQGEVLSIHDWIIMTGMVYVWFLFFFSCVLPVQLKFGSTNNNAPMFIAMAVFALCIYLIYQIGLWCGIDFMLVLDSLEPLMLLGIMILITCVTWYISYRISCYIIEKREF